MPTPLSRWNYATPEPLAARIGLHARYGTARVPWHRWVFERLGLRPGTTLLEVGCGPGTIWRENAGRLPTGLRLRLTDASPGMVDAARATLRQVEVDAEVTAADAQRLPFDDASVDVALAAHMLYHVADRARAIAELRRVLRPGGRLVATTNGRAHLRELEAFAVRHVPGWTPPDPAAAFGLENGEAQLRGAFAEVAVDRHDGGLVVPDAAPLLAYLRSMPGLEALGPTDLLRLGAALEADLAAHGPLRITTESGAFLAG